MQKEGIERIESFNDNFRKTGNLASLAPELRYAEQKLAASLDGFIRFNDHPAAALSLIKLGDIHRSLERWETALGYYRQAHQQAAMAKHDEYQAMALMGMARVEMYGLRQYGDAALHIEEALQLSSRLPNKKHLFDALDFKGQVQIYRRDLIGAADSLNRALSLVPEIHDKGLQFYVYLDRADMYQKLAEQCDYQRSFEPCYEALELSKADYAKALQLAREMAFHYLASQTEGFLRRLEIRRSMISSQQRFHDQLIQSGIFSPKKPGDVLVQEQFISSGQSIPAGILNMIQQSGALSGGDPRSFYLQGLMHEMQGNDTKALELYRHAVALLEEDRGNLKDEKSRGAFLEDKIEFYYTPMLHLLDRRQFSEAFECMEKSRSRAMADLLANKQIVLSNEEARRSYASFLRLKTEIAALQKSLFEYRARPDSEKYSGAIADYEKRIAAFPVLPLRPPM
jgi:tetratricopeptide (TPR) repeat protein